MHASFRNRTPLALLFERYTAHFHLRAALGMGALHGVFVLNEVIARKHFGADRWQILAMMLIPATTQLMAVFWNPASGNSFVGRHPFRTLGIGIHLLLGLPLVTGGQWNAWAFVWLLTTIWVAQFLLVPVQNAIVARNYGPAVRGRWFGRAAALQGLAVLAISVPVGLWMDHDVGRWPWIYAFAGLSGVFAYVQWGRIRRRRALAIAEDLEVHPSAWKALLKDKAFLGYEAAFMVYGLGFLALQPVLPLYVVDELGVSYTEFGIARGAIFWVFMIAMSPIAGRLGDRLGILRVAGLGFIILGLFPLALWVLPTTLGMFIGYAIFGLAMGCVNIGWNLGPIAMARGRDPVPYLNAHVAAVGIRALVGMTLGTVLHDLFGTTPVFLGVLALEIIACAQILRLAMRTPALRA